MEGNEPRQYWIRNEHGKVWGPLTFATIELLIDNGMIQGRLQASRDGLDFAMPGRYPDVRDAFPRELWGDSTEAIPDNAPPPPRPAAPAGGRPGAPPVIGAPPTLGAQGQAVPKVAPAAAPAAPARSSPTPVPQPAPRAAPVVSPTPVPQAAPRATAAAQPAAAPALSGELAASGALAAWYRIAAEGMTGKLTLEGPKTYTIYFRKGFPEAVGSSDPEEDFGQFAVSRGLLQPQQLVDARAMLAGFGGEIVNALFGMRLINPGDAFQLIGEHAVSLLPRALAMEEGRYQLDAAAPAPSTAMPLGDRWKLIADAVRGWPLPEIRRRLGASLAAPVMRSGGKVDLADLKLTAQEARVIGWFDGVRSLDELAAAMPAEAELIVRVGFLLSNFEAVAFAARSSRPPPARPAASAAAPAPAARPTPPPQAPNPAAATPPAPATPRPAQPARTPPVVQAAGAPAAAPRPAPVIAPAAGARPAQPAAPARPPPTVAPARVPPKIAPAAPAAAGPGDDLPKLRAFAEQLAKKNHFEVLGLPENTTAAQVKTAYFTLAKSFHPDTVSAGAPPELAALKADVFARVGEAYRVLGDDKSRAAYLDELKFGGSEQVDVGSILAAEEAFQKGCILVRARKFPEAVQMLDEAIKLNDQEGEYYAWRAWARFAAAVDKAKAKESALREIETSIKMNPRCAMGYYFAGQISKLLGDAPGAESWFKKTLGVDANHLEAQRELRLLAGRKQ